MPDDKGKSEEKSLKALEVELAKVKALYEASQKEQASLLEEKKQLMDAAFFAAQYGNIFVANYHASIRQICEQTDIDADSLIRKLPALTLDIALPAGKGRYMEKLREANICISQSAY